MGIIVVGSHLGIVLVQATPKMIASMTRGEVEKSEADTMRHDYLAPPRKQQEIKLLAAETLAMSRPANLSRLAFQLTRIAAR